MEFDFATLIPLVPNLFIAVWVIRALLQMVDKMLEQQKWMLEKLLNLTTIQDLTVNNQEETD